MIDTNETMCREPGAVSNMEAEGVNVCKGYGASKGDRLALEQVSP